MYLDAIDGPDEDRVSSRSLPLVSIVTPSLNQAGYIAETLRSVAIQDYPRIEHIVVDGGSTDGTVEILTEWGGHWISEPDQGQADAINKGVMLSSGDISCWLNSDDVYLDSGAISRVVQRFLGGADAVSAAGRYVDADGLPLGPTAFEPARMTHDWLRSIDYLLQPATFYRTELARDLPLDASLRWTFDWDFFIRLSERTTIEPMADPIAGYRLQPQAKTLTGGFARQRELLKIIGRYKGRASSDFWMFGLVVGARELLWRLPYPVSRIAWDRVWNLATAMYRASGRAGRLPT